MRVRFTETGTIGLPERFSYVYLEDRQNLLNRSQQQSCFPDRRSDVNGPVLQLPTCVLWVTLPPSPNCCLFDWVWLIGDSVLAFHQQRESSSVVWWGTTQGGGLDKPTLGGGSEMTRVILNSGSGLLLVCHVLNGVEVMPLSPKPLSAPGGAWLWVDSLKEPIGQPCHGAADRNAKSTQRLHNMSTVSQIVNITVTSVQHSTEIKTIVIIQHGELFQMEWIDTPLSPGGLLPLCLSTVWTLRGGTCGHS